jgi:hypothetical protein
MIGEMGSVPRRSKALTHGGTDPKFSKGQESGEFQKEISAYKITLFITRSMRGSIYDWFLFKDEYNLVTESVKYIEIFLKGIKK